MLLDGVVRTRGRIWLANRPDTVLWLESAGGGLRIGHAGDWLAAADPDRISAALHAALLTDPELTAGQAAWRHYPDPFGHWHTDPCEQTTPQPVRGRDQEGRA